ncbi:MAG: hypothetical protein WCA38_04155 [Candidatus Acidiferrales bacterium]
MGASRGLGCALAAEYLKRGWHVVATVRDTSKTRLHDILENSSGRLEIETVDINFPDQVAALENITSAGALTLFLVTTAATGSPPIAKISDVVVAWILNFGDINL